MGRSLLVAVWLTIGSGAIACHQAPVAPVVDDRAAPGTTPPAPFTRLPRDAARFEIDVVDDTSARFKPREARWVQPGLTAYAVDPMHRDVLVARMRIVSVWNETAVAVVTSQVTRVTTQHVVLLVPPAVPWWRSRRFWLGTLLGALVGGAAAGVIAAQ